MIPKKKNCICRCISSLHFALHFGFIQQILLFGTFIAPEKMHLSLHFGFFVAFQFCFILMMPIMIF
jgi:hypothetical protein